jgi:hypothetical protein
MKKKKKPIIKRLSAKTGRKSKVKQQQTRKVSKHMADYYVKSSSPITPVDVEEVPPPLVIWGPGDPRPTLPIAGWDPGSGTFPPETEEPPLDFWGPNDPRPTPPIAEPPWGWGNPAPPIEPPPPPGMQVKYLWTAETGWITVIIPEGPVVTPSKRK